MLANNLILFALKTGVLQYSEPISLRFLFKFFFLRKQFLSGFSFAYSWLHFLQQDYVYFQKQKSVFFIWFCTIRNVRKENCVRVIARDIIHESKPLYVSILKLQHFVTLQSILKNVCICSKYTFKFHSLNFVIEMLCYNLDGIIDILNFNQSLDRDFCID